MLKPPASAPLSLAECQARAQSIAPALKRRMAAWLYEGVLLFGIVVPVGLVFGVLAQQRHGMVHREGLQATLFLAFSLYFIWFWVHGGQTLAMRTWHLRLVRQDGQPLRLMQAGLRCVASWAWFWPPLLLARLGSWHHQTSQIFTVMLLWIAVYAALSLFLPRRQFLHDWVCGTCLIDTRADTAA
jgi:uncharacterized RDD family membrane protein YckC